MTKAQLSLGDKHVFGYARGRAQVHESFEMVQLARDLTDAEFSNSVWITTNINTNSPRILDRPMAEGIIDFARAGQMSIITPFCLAGAMAPITLSGALVLQHAEALAGITLAQLTQTGAPVAYGGFSSNVDMKSGSPAFGTPEHCKFSIGAGQLARHVVFPWRGSGGSASNTHDMQSAGENHMALWSNMLGNATLIVHAAGWLEGGLSFGYEKFINDVESLQILAEMCSPSLEDRASLAWDALADVKPGGHFFETPHTMERYRDAFYEPLVAVRDNYGLWAENGAKDSSTRAMAIWKKIIADFKAPDLSEQVADVLAPNIERGRSAGGAPITE